MVRSSRQVSRAFLVAVVSIPLVGYSDEEPAFIPVTDAMLADPPAEDWLTWRRTNDAWGYSPLDQVTPENVAKLEQVWTRPLRQGSQTATPLVYDGVMYMPNPNDVIQALDAVTGELIWEHERETPESARRTAGLLGSNNRNIAIYGNLIIDTGVDASLFALDAETGEMVWETPVLDYRENPAIQGAGPIIANGKAVSGRSCLPYRGPHACVIVALDAMTGKEVWRRRLIPAPGEHGDESWGDMPFEERSHVGSWMVPSYDPELDVVFVGTSVTAPTPKFMLQGSDKQYLYHNSTLALDGDTGEIRWYYQHLIDHWDLDHPFERMLLDTAVAPDPEDVPWINPAIEPGETRKVMTGIPGKTALIYTLDRETGEFLWARPTVEQNVVATIDGKTGKVTGEPDSIPTEMGQTLNICPSMHGGKDWEAGAYSPLTNTMYFPLRNACMPTLITTSRDASHSYYALSVGFELSPGKTDLGSVYAVSAQTGATTWLYEQRASTTSVVATGGGLLFLGDTGGGFMALDQANGEVLWRVELGSPVTGFPIAYGVDGRQYVAVSTGFSATTGSFLRMTPELKPSFGNNLYVFALPES